MPQVNDSLLLQIRRRLLRRASYRKIFCEADGQLKPEAQIVMADLMHICRYNETALVVTDGKTDVPGTMAMEGQRSILYRIIQMCRMDDSDLVEAEKKLRHSESNFIGATHG